MGQMGLEGSNRLVHQGHPVRQEQGALGPAGAHELVDECDHGPGLAAAGRHDQQCLAQVVQLEGLVDAADGAGLIEAPGDGLVDGDRAQRLAGGATQDEQLKLSLLEKPLDRAGRVTGIVPDPVLIAVGIEDDRPAAVHGLQAVRIEFGLLPAHPRVALGALGLDDRQRPAVRAPKDIVDKALARVVRHPGDRKLPVPYLIQRPAGLAQQQVDEDIPRLRLVVVVVVRDRLVGLLGGGDL